MGVSAVPKKSVLFVSRLDLKTKIKNLQNYVRFFFPEAECSARKSKYYEHYSSFKITIDFCNYESAMDPDNWPAGAYIQKFFQKKKTH